MLYMLAHSGHGGRRVTQLSQQFVRDLIRQKLVYVTYGGWLEYKIDLSEFNKDILDARVRIELRRMHEEIGNDIDTCQTTLLYTSPNDPREVWHNRI